MHCRQSPRPHSLWKCSAPAQIPADHPPHNIYKHLRCSSTRRVHRQNVHPHWNGSCADRNPVHIVKYLLTWCVLFRSWCGKSLHGQVRCLPHREISDPVLLLRNVHEVWRLFRQLHVQVPYEKCHPRSRQLRHPHSDASYWLFHHGNLRQRGNGPHHQVLHNSHAFRQSTFC